MPWLSPVGLIYVGKESNKLDEHEAERTLEYHDSEFDDLVRRLRCIPTKMIVVATGYNERTVRRLKRGEFRPSPNKISSLVCLCAQLIGGTN